MTDRDKVCFKCPLPDCREADPACLLGKGKKEELYIPSPSRPMTIQETATQIRCSTDWLRKEIRKFRSGLPASVPRFFMVGNRYRWDPEDVEAWLASRKQGGTV